MIRALMGIDEDADVEVRSSDAEVIGNEGSVQIEFSIDGDVVAAQGGDSVDWVFANGEWYSEDVIGSGTC